MDHASAVTFLDQEVLYIEFAHDGFLPFDSGPNIKVNCAWFRTKNVRVSLYGK